MKIFGKDIGFDISVLASALFLIAVSFGISRIEIASRSVEGQIPMFVMTTNIDVKPVIEPKMNKDAVKIGDFMSLAKSSKSEHVPSPEQTDEVQGEEKEQNGIKILFSGFSKKKAIPPKIIYSPMPDYPIKSVENGEQGDVSARLFILSNGRVDRVEIDKKSGNEVLDKSSVAALTNWIFEPAVELKYPIHSWLKVIVRFRLK